MIFPLKIVAQRPFWLMVRTTLTGNVFQIAFRFGSDQIPGYGDLERQPAEF